MPEIRLPEKSPHEQVGSMLIEAIEGGQKAGESISSALDTPVKAVGVKQGPHRLVGNTLDLIANTMKGLIKQVTK